MDGTIVDTEPYWIEAEHALVTAHGGQWSHAQAMQLVGQSLVFSAGILQKAGVPPRSGARSSTRSRPTSSARSGRPSRGGPERVNSSRRCTHAGVRCALVTMSEAPLAREIVASLPKPYFEFLVTGDTVTHGKPHPEAYLTAVELLRQQDPDLTCITCVALEDSGPASPPPWPPAWSRWPSRTSSRCRDDSRHALWDTLEGRTVADLEDSWPLRHEFPAAGRSGSGQSAVTEPARD